MVNVKISEKGGQQSNYEFDKPEVTIGRMKGNDIVLPKGNVSKKHARIYDRSGTLMIDDLDSTNGTYVNGRKVTSEHEITESDKIYIGDFILQVQPERQQAGGPPEAPPQPPGGGPGATESSPPSPPQAGEPGGAPGGGAPGGGTPGGGTPGGGASSGQSEGGPLDSLDDKYGGSSDSSAPNPPSRDSHNTGGPAASGGGPAQSGGGPASGAAQSRDDQGGGGRARSATERDRPVHGGQDRGPQDRGSAPGSSPGGEPSQSSSPGPQRGGGGSAPSSTPGSRPKRRDSAGRRDSGRDRRESGDRAPSGREEPPAGDRRDEGGRERRPSSERFRQNLRAERTPEGPTGRPVLPPELDSDFDEDFHEAQREVAEVLLDEIDLEDLPEDYPPSDDDREEFEEIVHDAVHDAKPRRVDRDTLIEVMTSECVALGPLGDYLDDPEIQNIYVNSFDNVVLRRGRDVVVAEHAFSAPELLKVVADRLRETPEEEAMTDDVQFEDGTRIQIMSGAITVEGPVVTVRKSPAEHPSLTELVDDGVLSEPMREFLESAVEAGQSILVAGPTSSGKTTLLEAIASEIPDGSRMVVVEETSQLELPQRGVVRLEARPDEDHDLESVLDAAVGMHPERILLDECRGGEAYTWVSSAASGTKGSMATIHGLNAADALERLESLSLLGSGEISPRGLREQIARAVDLVVTVHRSNDGTFRVHQITEVQGVDLDAFRLNDVFYYRRDGTSGAFHPTGYIPLFYEDLRQLGRDVDLDIFRE